MYFTWCLLALGAVGLLFLFKCLKVNLQSYNFWRTASRKCKDYSHWQQYPQDALLHKKTQQRIFNVFAKQFAATASSDFCFILQWSDDQKGISWQLLAGVAFGRLLIGQADWDDAVSADFAWLIPLCQEKKVLIKQHVQEGTFQKMLQAHLPNQAGKASQIWQLLAIPLPSLANTGQIIVLGRLGHKPFSLAILKNLSDCLQSLSLFIDQYQRIEMLERTMAERADSEKRFLDIFEANPLPLLVFDKQGLLVKANQAFFKHFANTLQPVISIDTICHIFSCSQKLSNDFKLALAQPVVEGACECLLSTVPPRSLPTFWSYRFLQIGQGDNILLELQDVSLQWQTRYYQGLFEKFFHSAKNGFCVVDQEEKIVFINKFLSEQILHCQENVEGQSFFQVFAIKNWQLALQKSLEFTLSLPTMPAPKTVVLSAIAFHDVQPLTLLSFVDVSEQKAREMQLLQLAKMESIGVFACGLSHDFNNIITIIKGNVDFLLSELGNDAEIKALLDDTQSAVEEGRQVIQRLLKFARGYHEEIAPYRLKDILKTLKVLLKRVLSQDIQLVWQEKALPEQLEVAVNLSCFDNALLNLFINARQSLLEKFSSQALAAAKITFSAETVDLDAALPVKSGELPPGKYVVLSIWDNGLGMDEALKNNILKPFYTTKPGGSGLGLSMVLHCVEQARGGIDFDGAAGDWAMFRLYFPLVA